MAGVRQFDEEAVLEKALELFWRNGLHATSMPGLAEATGVQRGSLYNAYGDKESLFLLAFERHYKRRFLNVAREALSKPDAREALTALFDVAIDSMSAGRPTRGCLTTKTALEIDLLGEKVAESLRRLLDEFQILVEQALSRPGVSERLALSPQAAATVIVTFTRGLAVMERIYRDPAKLRQSAADFTWMLFRPDDNAS